LAGSIALACVISIAAVAWSAERQLHRVAAVGETIRLRGHVNFNPCGTTIATTITVVRTPIHGTLATHNETVKAGDPELGTGDRCRGDSGQGKVVYYTRTSPGADQFEYTSSSANGVVKVDVTVD